ncbi:MAG: hypothetical protein HRU28_14890 [Rhizobiales bacterium]|nr:hypothetical protein [Hyphomicrobiales bacterium]
MALKIAVQMDPIEEIDITGDSSFAIMLAAQNRGADIFCYSCLGPAPCRVRDPASSVF